jgi:hypothetical protein
MAVTFVRAFTIEWRLQVKLWLDIIGRQRVGRVTASVAFLTARLNAALAVLARMACNGFRK